MKIINKGNTAFRKFARSLLSGVSVVLPRNDIGVNELLYFITCRRRRKNINYFPNFFLHHSSRIHYTFASRPGRKRSNGPTARSRPSNRLKTTRVSKTVFTLLPRPPVRVNNNVFAPCLKIISKRV